MLLLIDFEVPINEENISDKMSVLRYSMANVYVNRLDENFAEEERMVEVDRC